MDWLNKGSTRLSVIRLISMMKHFYTFKELEELLGIPYQRLWRYIALQAVPEKNTIEKIIQNIRSKKLIEKLLKQLMGETERGFKIWKAVKKIGFLELIGFMATNMLKNEAIDFDVIVSFPDEYSATIATIIAEYLDSNLCIASKNPSTKDVIAETYTSRLTYNLELLAIPRGCIEKKKGVLLVTFEINDLNVFHAALRLVERSLAVPRKVLAITVNKEVLEQLKSESEYKENMILIIHN
ncbi:MAG: hypothetical protein L6N96_01025 [Candidatus Methylarchaceae archaeon HK02M2]|nr:hypothetical protein [Candidatus Methylarchaceae archaeon HK02M2]